MEFWVSRAGGTKHSTKGTCRTCWTKLTSYAEEGKKIIDTKKVTLVDI